MEAGFKRLFGRKKNKSRAGQSSTTPEPKPLPPPSKPFASSPLGRFTPSHHSRPSASDIPRPGNIEKREFSASPTANGHAIQPPRSKIQPVLLGISSPVSDQERPGTSGSFQHAISRAADKVAQANDVRRSPNKKVPRYIDIFEISHMKTPNTYNEDVAERNIDTVRVALDSGAHYRYVSSSVYQEEVATRNAYPSSITRPSLDISRPARTSFDVVPPRKMSLDTSRPSKAALDVTRPHRPSFDSTRPAESRVDPTRPSKPSFDIIRPSRDEPRESFDIELPIQSKPPATTGRMSLELPRPKTSFVQDSGNAFAKVARRRSKSASTNADAVAKAEMSADPIGYHWRQNKEGAAEYAKQLPALPPGMESTENVADAANYQNVEDRLPAILAQASKRTNRQEPPVTTAERLDLGPSLPKYQLSRSELPPPQRADARPVSPAVSLELPKEGIRRPGYVPPSPRAESAASSIKRHIALPNRTIMDLTGNDSQVFLDGYLDSALSTPTIATAMSNSYQHVYPTVVTTKKIDNMSPLSETSNPLAHVDPVADEQSPESDVLAPMIPERHPLRNTGSSSFSPINTLVSVAPKNLKSNDTISGTTTDSTRPVPQPRGPTGKRLSRVIEVDSEPNSGATSPKPIEESQRAEQLQRPTRVPQLSPSAQVNVVDFQPRETARSFGSSQASVSSTRASSETRPSADSMSSPIQNDLISRMPAVQVTPVPIQTSPESLASADFTNPGHAFGVLTRDFAQSPTQPSISRSVSAGAPEFNVGAHAKSSYKTVTIIEPSTQDMSSLGPQTRPKPVSKTPSYSSTFDEAEFARKQEQARAALIKLQQSLDEDLTDTNHYKTRPTTRKFWSETNGIHKNQNSTDGPIAPTSIYAHARGDSEDSVFGRGRTIHDLVTHQVDSNTDRVVTTTKINKGKGREQDLLQRPRTTQSQSYQERMSDLVKQAASLNMLAPHTNNRNQSSSPHTDASQSKFPPSPVEASFSSFAGTHNPEPVSTYQPHTPTASVSLSNPRALNPPATNSLTTTQSPRVKMASENYRPLQRRGSTRSQTSSMNSAFSIPFHMIPDRSSSMRDSLVREIAGEEEAVY